MSLVPTLIAMLVVALVTGASVRLVQDAGLAASRQADRLMARQQAQAALREAEDALVRGYGGRLSHPSVTHHEIPSSGQSDLGDLPLVLHRLTATGEARYGKVTQQADYALDGCDIDDDCQPRLRRIAWREVLVE